jgi:16S rRNA (guanine966-N2)-methyltransferase
LPPACRGPVRVISGSARGRRLLAPKDLRIRPTSDRVKEALFSILTVFSGGFAGRRVLDIFAGTGNLGIEALSRGASYALFVDESREAAALVKKNLELTGFAGNGKVLHKEALSALKSLGKLETPFEFVFLDPPYRQGLSAKVLDFLAVSELIDEGSVIVVETASREDLAGSFCRLRKFDQRIYGDTALAFFSLARE